MNAETNHYGRKMELNPASAPCHNFFMSKQSCCSQGTLDSLFSMFARYHELSYGGLKYPIVKLVEDQERELRRYSCRFEKLTDDPVFQALETQYERLMAELMEY